ncbi:MAG TPA: GNAT family N-acetyltransferase [Caldimonas sp.]|jgi:RimJ/RimL family protein N-acetyltransferase
MTRSPSDDGYTEAIALRDGTPATIRVMRSDDRGRLEAAFASLDRDSIYTRFFGLRNELPGRALDRIAEIDFVQLAGLVATVGRNGGEVIVGSCTYVGLDDGSGAAEVAFTIADGYQGQGLGGRLLAAMAGFARRHGLARFTADVLANNAAMLKVFQRSGLPMTTRRESGGVIRVELALAQPPA